MTGLMDTTDGMIWASEFCRIFAGKGIGVAGHGIGTGKAENMIDEGTMVGWFANAIEVGRSAGVRQVPTEGPWYAFLHFYHLDKSNAAFHCSEVRFSPVTFRLAEHLFETHDVNALLSDEFGEVHNALGAYEEDHGR